MGDGKSGPSFQFGRTTAIGSCCGKPQGCNQPLDGCLYKLHPSRSGKGRCTALSIHDDPQTGAREMHRCNLPINHTGPHDAILFAKAPNIHETPVPVAKFGVDGWPV